MGCPLPRVLGVVSDAAKVGFSNINSQMGELLRLVVLTDLFADLTTNWTETDADAKVNAAGNVCTMDGDGASYAAHGIRSKVGVTRAGICFQIDFSVAATLANNAWVIGVTNTDAQPNGAAAGTFGTSLSNLTLTSVQGPNSLGTQLVSAATWYTMRLYVTLSADGSSWRKLRITIQGGAYSSETDLGISDQTATAYLDPLYFFVGRRASSAGNLISYRNYYVKTGYATDGSGYIRYSHDAGAGKVFNNIDFTAFALPGSVPSTNLTFKYYFGDSATPSMSAAYTLAQLQALGKISENHRYFVIDSIGGSDGETQCYIDKPNSATATDGIGQWAALGNVRETDNNQLAAGTLANNDILQGAGGNFVSGNLSNDKIQAGTNWGVGQAGTHRTIRGIDKPRLSTAGGEVVTVTGIGFLALTGAKINGSGGTPCTAFAVDGDTQIHFTTPAMAEGVYSLYITGGSYESVTQDKAFEYDADLYTALEEAARNKFNTGSSVADLLLTKSVKLLNVDNNGTYAGVAAPGVITISSADGTGPTTIRVNFSWVANAEHIYIERSSSPLGTYAQIADKTSGNYFDDTVTAGQTWYYRARAYNSGGYGVYGTVVEGVARTTNEIEQGLWSTFKTKMQADSYLAAYIERWKFDKAEAILAPGKFPVFKAWILSTREEWIAVPKRKVVIPRIIIHGLVKVKNSVNLETEKLKMDEYIKNAIEAEMTFSGGVTMNIVGDSIFRNLDDSTAEIFIECDVMSKIFTAGQR